MVEKKSERKRAKGKGNPKDSGESGSSDDFRDLSDPLDHQIGQAYLDAVDLYGEANFLLVHQCLFIKGIRCSLDNLKVRMRSLCLV